MSKKQRKEKGDKAKCTDFGSSFKGFKGISEMMSKCCMGQGGSTDCSAMMDGMMKGMMEMCCGQKADNTKEDCDHERV